MLLPAASPGQVLLLAAGSCCLTRIPQEVDPDANKIQIPVEHGNRGTVHCPSALSCRAQAQQQQQQQQYGA
jgi:hypothetical protein